MSTFEKAIIKRIDIFLKLFSNFLVIKTIESNTVKSLTDKQLETITPVATDKLKTINENIKRTRTVQVENQQPKRIASELFRKIFIHSYDNIYAWTWRSRW